MKKINDVSIPWSSVMSSCHIQQFAGAEMSLVVYHGDQAKEANIMYQEFCKLRDTKTPLAVKGTAMALFTSNVEFLKIDNLTRGGFINPWIYRVTVKGIFR